MPKLIVKNIASFSTEDPVHTANNLLSSDAHKKWKCNSPGEKSATIILQLDTPNKITAIDIGNEHSAYVEVLVNRSGKSDDFIVLLVMSSFMTPTEAKQSLNTNKVRMFNYNDLQSPERDEKWDLVKIVCTQPFNRHVQYGLSFITLHTLDNNEQKDFETPEKLGNFILRPKSPSNVSLVGSLFARRKQLSAESSVSPAAAIREASSSPSSSDYKLKLNNCINPIKDIKDKLKNDSDSNNVARPRNRDELLYTADEKKPNKKIDKLINDRNKEIQEKQSKEEMKKLKPSNKEKTSSNLSLPSTSNKLESKIAMGLNKRKLDSPRTSSKKIKTDQKYKDFKELLSGVTIVISGIQNPERANIRQNALAMGAKYKPDWDDTCTHLICAFTNTPKFNQVKGKGKIVNKDWIIACFSQRKRLPWRRFALDKADKTKTESEEEIWEKKEEEIQVIYKREEDDTDTEDEIERITGVREPKQENKCFLAETDEEEEVVRGQRNLTLPDLPDFFSNKYFYIDKELSEPIKTLLARYIVAFNGSLTLEPSDAVDYLISSSKSSNILGIICPDAHVVSPEWIWECHNSKKLVAPDAYKI